MHVSRQIIERLVSGVRGFPGAVNWLAALPVLSSIGQHGDNTDGGYHDQQRQ